MASYQISVRNGVTDTDELRVLLFDGGEQPMVELDALSADHARWIAHDLMVLVRHRDPVGSFVVDTHVEPGLAA